MARADSEWAELEYVAVADRTNDKGILLFETKASDNGVASEFSATPYELSRRVFDRQTGRSKPIICDFCYTWQAGANAGRITFVRKFDQHSFTFLCCADLACSAHVRGKTPQATLSRAQLHEDLTPEQRIARLRQKLARLARDLQLTAIT